MNKFDFLRKRAAVRAEVPQPAPVADSIKNRLESKIASSGAPQHFQFAEIRRICGLPIIFPMDEKEREEYNRRHLLASAFDAGFRLFPVQCEALAGYEQFSGVLGPIGVGFGKTLVTLMVANCAYQKGLKKITLSVPPNVYAQLMMTDLKWARTRVPISFPVHPMGGMPMGRRRMLAKSGKKGLYIIPYSLLSTKDTSEVLHAIRPELMILDEAHNLANRSAARTRRVMEYVDEHRPECVALSGTITSKSVMDYYHLIRWALGGNNPLPNTATLAHEWGNVIDASAGGEVGEQAKTGPLTPLISWARERFPRLPISDDTTGFRRAYKLRLNTAPGVVSSGDAAIGTSLILHNEPVKEPEKVEGWDRLRSLTDAVEEQWITPNGDEIEHAIHTWKWLNELSAGFYNEQVWPAVEVFAERKQISEAEAETILQKAREHHAAGQVYASALRRWLEERSKPGMDTPMLVGGEMARNGAQNVGAELYDLWRDWHRLDFEGRPDRDSNAIRVCPYKVNAAIEWAMSLPRGRGAIIWVYHQEIGRWVYDLLCESGADAMHCPAGEQHNRAIVDPANANKIVVASMTAHGTGKNLQHFQEQFFVQWPRSPRDAEQALGRTHRNGQKADELVVNQCNTSAFDELNFAACLNDALYIHQTTGNRQKLIYANYDPVPKVFPPAVLHERGLQNKMLSAEQQAIMDAKFGN